VATSSTAVFISRVLGLPVLDAAGDQVGKVRDAVIQLRAFNRPPRVKGLVVELFARRRIFVPMARVHAVDAAQVAITGTVDTRRFARREAEILVIDDLFDRQVTLGDGRKVAIFDVAMRPARSREWELADVALREVTQTSRFRIGQRGQVVIVDWSEVPQLALSSAQTTEHVVAKMSDMLPADVARELHDMTAERRAEVANALDNNQLADALEEMPEDEQVELISSLDTERAADVLEEMDPDDAADLIKDLPADVAEDLLGRMEPDEAKDVRNLLLYEESTAGGMMTPEPVVMAADSTVADALARIRSEELTPALASMVFICRPPLDTPSGRYLGAVHFQRLLREAPSAMVSTLIDQAVAPLTPSAALPDVSRYFATYNLVVAAVVNSDHQLVGAVTVDDVLDHMLPEDWRGEQMDDLDPAEVTRG